MNKSTTNKTYYGIVETIQIFSDSSKKIYEEKNILKLTTNENGVLNKLKELYDDNTLMAFKVYELNKLLTKYLSKPIELEDYSIEKKTVNRNNFRIEIKLQTIDNDKLISTLEVKKIKILD